MAHYRTDKEFTTVNSVFTWAFILCGGNGARVNRRISKCLAKRRAINSGVAIYWIRKNSDLQNPPSGPPIFSL